MRRTARLALLSTGAAGALAAAAMVIPAALAADTNTIANPGFETGSLSSWTCSPVDSVVSSPVHSGSRALAGAASASDNAQCSQTVTVAANTNYTLSAYVNGAYVFLGGHNPVQARVLSSWGIVPLFSEEDDIGKGLQQFLEGLLREVRGEPKSDRSESR